MCWSTVVIVHERSQLHLSGIPGLLHVINLLNDQVQLTLLLSALSRTVSLWMTQRFIMA